MPAIPFHYPVFFRLLLLLVTMFALHACGFQLRGTLEVSPDLSPVYLQRSSAFQLAREIKVLLATNKVDVTNTIKHAKTQLHLVDEIQDSRVLSVDSEGAAKEYLLTYTVKFRILLNHSGNWDGGDYPETISVSRTLLFDKTAVLAVSNESVLLYEDMRREVARLILLRMQARSSDEKTAQR